MNALFFAVVLIGATLTARASDQAAAVTANATNSFTVTGMVCDGCAKGILAELKLAPGVATADVSFSNKLAIVAYDTNKTSTAKLVQVITEAGFEAKSQKP